MKYYDKLIFELSRPGRKGYELPKNEYGIDTDKWIGKKITLYFDPSVRFGKETPGGVRCEIPREEPLPKCENCGRDIQGAGRMTPEQTAAYTKSKYGKALCADCATAAAKAETR